jgi:hypothetical protein
MIDTEIDYVYNQTMITTPLMTIDDPDSMITLSAGSSEMLRVAKDGFYVRGVRVNQDEKEAEKVYNAFNQWLTWATLARDY